MIVCACLLDILNHSLDEIVESIESDLKERVSRTEWMQQPWKMAEITSSVLEAEVREAPDISQTHGDADAGEEEIQLIGPSSALVGLLNVVAVAILNLFVGAVGSLWLFTSFITLLYILGRGFNFLPAHCNTFRFQEKLKKNSRHFSPFLLHLLLLLLLLLLHLLLFFGTFKKTSCFFFFSSSIMIIMIITIGGGP